MFSTVPLADGFAHPLTAHPGWWPASWMAVAGFALLFVGFDSSCGRVGRQLATAMVARLAATP